MNDCHILMELSHTTLRHLVSIKQTDSVESLRHDAAHQLKSIDVVTQPISYDRFFTKYLTLNVPCLIGGWATSDWLSVNTWCHDNGQINWKLLTRHFGEASVPVADCTEQHEYSQSKSTLKFSEFSEYMTSADRNKQHILYLKDWHFKRDFPAFCAYTTPVYFQSDWLNEFWDSRLDSSDDYRFVYIGPRESWTPFHADVMRSYSWSANVCGKKKWILVPAGDEELLKDANGCVPFDVTREMLESANVKFFELTQCAGEVLFVPSGWYHQVVNMEDTISINHNWLNASNADIVWKYINDNLTSVEHEIQEHQRTMDNWTEHCQLFLKANIGIDFTDFYNLLYTVASHRLTAVRSTSAARSDPNERSVSVNNDAPLAESKVPSDLGQPVAFCKLSANVGRPSDDKSTSGCDTNHAVYDLFCIKNLIKEFVDNPKVNNIMCVNSEHLLGRCEELYAELQSALEDNTDRRM